MFILACSFVFQRTVFFLLSADWTGPGCPPPDVALNGSVPPLLAAERHRSDYNTEVTEVKFSGQIGPLGEKRLCKIKCIGGNWVGPLCQNQEGESRRC
jgi:hypothetical protein